MALTQPQLIEESVVQPRAGFTSGPEPIQVRGSIVSLQPRPAKHTHFACLDRSFAGLM